MKNSLQLSPTALDILFHLGCAMRRPSNWHWQWPGIGRELSFTHCRTSSRDIPHLHFTVGLVVAVVQLSFALKAQAIVASPHPVELSQPDGRKITLRIRGDEHLNWHEDMNGFTVVCHNGRYLYAARDARGALAPTKLEVGIADPESSGLTKGLLPARRTIERQQQGIEVDQSATRSATPSDCPTCTTGTTPVRASAPIA